MKQDEYKMRVRNEAIRLFLKLGLRSVSMDDIAAAVGSSKKTLYQYYTSKDDLVDDTIKTLFNNTLEECLTYREQSENAIHEEFLGLEQMVEFFQSMNPALINDLKKYHIKIYKKFMNYKYDVLWKLVAENLQRGIREGLYRQDLNIDILSRFWINADDILFSKDFYKNVKKGFVEVHLEMSYFFLHGAATLKGQKLIEKYKKLKSKKR